MIRKYFSRWTTINPAIMHDLTEDQERLQEAFSDKRLLLRYNRLLKCAQAWYDSQSGLYVVLNIKDHYSLAWVIWELRRRQKTKRELKSWYLKFDEEQENQFNKANEELAREATDLYFNYKKKKVVTSAHTKEVPSAKCSN